MESTARIERAIGAFAGPRLPTWLRRHGARPEIRTPHPSRKKRVYSTSVCRAWQLVPATGLEPVPNDLKGRCSAARATPAKSGGWSRTSALAEPNSAALPSWLLPIDGLCSVTEVEEMVWAVRFELTISCFRRTQDGHLPYAHANDGCGERIRTAACTAYEAAALPLGDTASNVVGDERLERSCRYDGGF